MVYCEITRIGRVYSGVNKKMGDGRREKRKVSELKKQENAGAWWGL